jgi:hypothetical protein
MRSYEERLQAAQRDGDRTHEREQALYLLEATGDAGGALGYARRNWAVQREPADVRIYAQAAASARSAADCALLARWITETHYEDRRLPSPLGCAAFPGSSP